MLESPLFVDGHRQAGDRLYAAADDLAFERVQLVVIPVREFDERNPFGNFDDVWQGEGTEADEAVLPTRGVGTHVAAALATRIGERVLYRVNAPAFVVQQ